MEAGISNKRIQWKVPSHKEFNLKINICWVADSYSDTKDFDLPLRRKKKVFFYLEMMVTEYKCENISFDETTHYIFSSNHSFKYNLIVNSSTFVKSTYPTILAKYFMLKILCEKIFVIITVNWKHTGQLIIIWKNSTYSCA